MPRNVAMPEATNAPTKNDRPTSPLARLMPTYVLTRSTKPAFLAQLVEG